MGKSQRASNIITRNSCRVCEHTDLKLVLSLGEQYLVDFIDSSTHDTPTAPLELVLCNKETGGCGLVQLKHTVPSELLYRKFWYKSGVNETMRNALADIVTKAQKFVKLNAGDIVVDIGANDGTLLRFYNTKDLISVGFEPAINLVEEAQEGTTKIINDFFNYKSFENEFHDKKAKIITSIAMFYDLEEPNKFVADIKKTLDKNGIWIIQMNYLVTMIENNSFDNIVHEHLEYYSLKSLEYLLNKHELTIFDVELNDLNGGSIRTYAKHRDCEEYPISKRIHELKAREDMMRLEDNEAYSKFANRIEDLKNKTCNFIKEQVAKGKKIYVYGASTRGNILLQYYNLNETLIKSAADRNPIKIGKEIIGTGITIITEEQARNEKPDYFLVLPWYFLDEFKKREHDYLKNGGKFIIPLPDLRIFELNENIKT